MSHWKKLLTHTTTCCWVTESRVGAELLVQWDRMWFKVPTKSTKRTLNRLFASGECFISLNMHFRMLPRSIWVRGLSPWMLKQSVISHSMYIHMTGLNSPTCSHPTCAPRFNTSGGENVSQYAVGPFWKSPHSSMLSTSQELVHILSKAYTRIEHRQYNGRLRLRTNISVAMSRADTVGAAADGSSPGEFWTSHANIFVDAV